MRDRLFGKRHARYRWLALVPAAVAAVFAAMVLVDSDVIASALPYLAVAVVATLYAVRPTLASWAIAFAAFLAYSVVIAIAPAVGYGGGPMTQWLVSLALGVVPSAALWIARPMRERRQR